MSDKLHIVTFAIPGFFGLILVEWCWGKIRRHEYYNWADSICNLSCGIEKHLLSVLTASWGMAIYLGIYHYRWLNLSGFLDGLAALVGIDFCYYWYHRVSHRVNFFWAGHIVHHQSEEYNLSVALRQTVTADVFSFLFYWPLALVGVSPMAFFASSGINLLYQFWIHTREIGKFPGIFELIFNTPSHHRVHHGINPQYLDKNYGGIFIFWDRWFNSFEPEVEEPAYGITKPLASFQSLWAQVHYFIELGQRAHGLSSWRERLILWVKPPEWLAAEEAEFDSGGLEPRKKYSPPIPRPREALGRLLFLLVLGFTVALSFYHDKISSAFQWTLFALNIIILALVGVCLTPARTQKTVNLKGLK